MGSGACDAPMFRFRAGAAPCPLEEVADLVVSDLGEVPGELRCQHASRLAPVGKAVHGPCHPLPAGTGSRYLENHSRARADTRSSVPGSSNRCEAAGTISSDLRTRS